MKRSYHSDVIISFQLGVLQPEILQQVPSSTLHNLKQRDLAKLVGTQQCLINEKNIRMVKDFLKHKQALKLAKAAYLAFNILKTFTHTTNAFRKWARSNKKFLVEKIQHLVLYFPLNKSLKLFDISSQAYHRWKNQVNCKNSLMHLCHKTHPFQLCSSEVANIKKYLSDKSLLHWPLASIYYQMIRQSEGYMSLSTFYKYSRCMLDNGMVPLRSKEQKKKYNPIRASAPLKILHMDITLLKTAENQRLYLYILQDNFSRAILSWTLSTEYGAAIALHNLKKGVDNNQSQKEDTMVICDDGSENKGLVKTYLEEQPSMQKVIAQKDIVQSNSMVEALNKRLKYHFIFHHTVNNEKHALQVIENAVNDYHQQPLKVLHGLTALEALKGQTPDKMQFSDKIREAAMNRPQINKQNTYTACS